MLFPYTYVPHQMDKMQEFVDYIFFDVWCNAPSNSKFCLELFDTNAELREVMETFYYSDKKNADFFYSCVERIFGHFRSLNTKQIRRLKWWYKSNNSVEKLCNNDPGIYAARYSDLENKFPTIAADIHKFFYGLYDFDAAPLKHKVGNIDEHYKSFVQVNSQGKCPFCGINDLFIEYHTKREAYDHYLPKAIYPFNSINLKNLAPACHHCNSSYKSTKNPAYSPKDPAGVMSRRKAFYPFSTIPYSIGLEVKLLHADIKNLAPSDIDLSFSPPMLTEEISTWKDVYGIEERYRAKFLSPSAKAWLEEVLTEQRWHSETAGIKGRTPEVYLEAVTCHASNFPYANENFLKHGFLQACKAVGMFDEPVKVNGT